MQDKSALEHSIVAPPPNDRRLEQASRLAAALFAQAKAARIATDPSALHPMMSAFLGEAGRAYMLAGLLFHDHEAPEKDQHALAVKLIAMCVDAWAVVDLAEAWTVDRCATCGATLGTDVEPCPCCGAPAVAPRHNPHRRGVFLSVLHVRESQLNYAWIAEARLAEDGRIVGWADDRTGEPYPVNPIGRFEAPWAIDNWMAHHIILNVPVLEQFLGHPASPKLAAAARWIETDVPPGFSFLRIDPDRMAKALRSVALETLIS